MAEVQQRFLTTKQAAKYLGIDYRTLQDWRCAKTGPAFIPINSRNVKYDIRDLDYWVDERRFTPSARGKEGRKACHSSVKSGRHIGGIPSLMAAKDIVAQLRNDRSRLPAR